MTNPTEEVKPPELEVVAYLVTGGRVFRDSVVKTREGVERDIASRKDGSIAGPLVRLSDAQAELAALRADAERYRWLRIEGACEAVCDDTWKDLKHADDLDAAIDAARQTTREQP